MKSKLSMKRGFDFEIDINHEDKTKHESKIVNPKDVLTSYHVKNDVTSNDIMVQGFMTLLPVTSYGTSLILMTMYLPFYGNPHLLCRCVSLLINTLAFYEDIPCFLCMIILTYHENVTHFLCTKFIRGENKNHLSLRLTASTS